MRYHMKSAADLSSMSIRRFNMELVNFREVHKHEAELRIKLAGMERK